MDNSSSKLYTTQIQPKQEWISIVDDFLTLSLNLIYGSRVEDLARIHDQQQTRNKFCFENVSYKIKTNKFYLNSQDSNNKTIIALIYFKRKGVKLIIEKWKFILNINESPKPTRLTFLKKKLFVLSRTIMSMIKILPAYSIFLQKGFDFSFGFELEYGKDDKDSNVNYSEMSLHNYSDNTGSIKVEVSYLLKHVIFKLEDDLTKQMAAEEVTMRRQRFLSGDTMDKHTSSNMKETSLEFVRHDSRSADKFKESERNAKLIESQKFNYKPESSYKTVETAGTSSGSANSLIDRELINHCDDLTTKFASIKFIERRVSELNTLYEGMEDSCDYESDDIAISNYSSVSNNSSDLELSIRADGDSFNDSFENEIEIDKILTKLNILRKYSSTNKLNMNVISLANKLKLYQK